VMFFIGLERRGEEDCGLMKVGCAVVQSAVFRHGREKAQPIIASKPI